MSDELHVTIKFGSGISGAVQGPAMLRFERMLREMMPGKWVEVFKDNKGDDSKLRAAMTPEQRSKL